LCPSQAPANDETDQASSSKSQYILGRIEQTADSNAKLPITLIKQTPKMDLAPHVVHKGNVSTLQTGVSESSYPPYVLGLWGGVLTVVSQYDKPNLQRSTDRRPGTQGLVIFHFLNSGNEIMLKPSTIFLPTISKKLKDCLMPSEELEAMKERAARRGMSLNPNRLMTRNPTIVLGNGDWVKLNGSTYQNTVTANTIRTLSKGIVEQDIVSMYRAQNSAGQTRVYYTEVICRFQQRNSDSEFAQVARITYDSDRTIARRVVLEGVVNRNWQKYAEAISQQLKRPWETIAQRHDI
jgi:hypothetical protein